MRVKQHVSISWVFRKTFAFTFLAIISFRVRDPDGLADRHTDSDLYTRFFSLTEHEIKLSAWCSGRFYHCVPSAHRRAALGTTVADLGLLVDMVKTKAQHSYYISIYEVHCPTQSITTAHIKLYFSASHM